MTSTHTFAVALAALVCPFSSFAAAQPKVLQEVAMAEAPQAPSLFRLTFANPKFGVSTLCKLDCDTGEATHCATLPMFLSPFAGAAYDGMCVYVLDDVSTSGTVPVAALHPETGEVVETFGVQRLGSATRYSDLAFLPMGAPPGKLFTNGYTDMGLNLRQIVCFDAGTGAIDHFVEPNFDGEPVADSGSLSGLTGDAQRGVLYSAYHPDGGGDVWAIAIDPDTGAVSPQVLIPDAQHVTGLAVCGRSLIAAGVDLAGLPFRTAIDLDTGDETRPFGPIGEFDSALAGDNVFEIGDLTPPEKVPTCKVTVTLVEVRTEGTFLGVGPKVGLHINTYRAGSSARGVGVDVEVMVEGDPVKVNKVVREYLRPKSAFPHKVVVTTKIKVTSGVNVLQKHVSSEFQEVVTKKVPVDCTDSKVSSNSVRFSNGFGQEISFTAVYRIDVEEVEVQ